MNYSIFFSALKNQAFDTILRLMIESAAGSDYSVKTATLAVLSPVSSLGLTMELIGSQRPVCYKIVADLDEVYAGEEVALHLSPHRMKIDFMAKTGHGWGILGGLFRVIPDLSPAYITSYLLEKKLSRELALFKQCSLALTPELEEVARSEHERLAKQ